MRTKNIIGRGNKPWIQYKNSDDFDDDDIVEKKSNIITLANGKTIDMNDYDILNIEYGNRVVIGYKTPQALKRLKENHRSIIDIITGALSTEQMEKIRNKEKLSKSSDLSGEAKTQLQIVDFISELIMKKYGEYYYDCPYTNTKYDLMALAPLDERDIMEITNLCIAIKENNRSRLFDLLDLCEKECDKNFDKEGNLKRNEEIYLKSRVDEYALMHAKYKDIVIKQNVFIRNDEIVWGFFDESKTITGLELAFRSKDAIMEFLYKIQFMANKESTLTQRLENHFREISYFSGKSINELLESDTRTYLEELVRLSDKIDSTLLDYNISYTSVDEKGNHVIINYTDDKLIIKSKVKSLSNQKDKENTTIEEDEVLDGLMHYASKRARIKKDIAKLSNSRILDDIFNYNKKDTPKGQELPIPIMDKKES